ncbi:non-specific lipid transfer protein GPI-anchored 5-like [Phragmites australis]|uniref:non-specific lipid transfer protein GPI-anchored 5-like n=1 Tax=Phragmites australis TaxID=29695 RepID=UPI002D77B23F|nr:non-specific lipid transfer protein GPI-anchored 5-like [Phragmites australis]
MAVRAAGALPVACLLAAVAAMVVALASAQSGCTTALIGLYPCLNYISGNVSTPPASCCSQLSSVVQSSPQCLCAALSGDSSALGGVTIDKTRALELPQACNVQTPPASKCNSAGGGNAPGGATQTTPSSGASAGAGTGSGSKGTPTWPYLTSGEASLRGPVSLVLGFAAVAVYAVSAI